MTVPYYKQLEQSERTLNFGFAVEDGFNYSDYGIRLLQDPNSTYSESLYIPNVSRMDLLKRFEREHDIRPSVAKFHPRIKGTYLSNSGSLIECIGGHKGNDFRYAIYNVGIDALLDVHEKTSLFLDTETLEKGIAHKKAILKELKNRNYTNLEEYMSSYYNYSAKIVLNSSLKDSNNKPIPFPQQQDAIAQNIAGIVQGDIEIYEYFLRLKKLVDDLTGITSYKSRETFGVILGEQPVFGITHELLRKSLETKNDFLVQFIWFTKIETVLRKTMTRIKPNFNEELFNYLISGWKVNLIQGFTIDEISRKIIPITASDFSFSTNYGLERELEKEIQLIRKHVPSAEIPNYFR